jgi:hypothetical protein
MGLDVLTGAAQGASLILTAGVAAPATAAVSAAKDSMKAALKKLGDKAIFSGLKATY